MAEDMTLQRWIFLALWINLISVYMIKMTISFVFMRIQLILSEDIYPFGETNLTAQEKSL